MSSTERRVDPSDGKAYTFAELSAFYAGKYKKKEIDGYWESCWPQKDKSEAKAKAKADARPAAEKSKDDAAPPLSQPTLKRSKSWLVKIGNITLLPCEDDLAPLVEKYNESAKKGDVSEMDAIQLQLLQQHPFVSANVSDVKPEALAEGLTAQTHNFKMNVPKFQKWLKSPAGKPFEEKGKGYDDGCYVASAVLRTFMPRGYTCFVLQDKAGNKGTAVLKGFLKFTGLTAADEDEESSATANTDAFMFHGYTREDAQRFVVTTKSNGENGKYTVRKLLGDWYCFAGSKNTGVMWRLSLDAAALYPQTANNPIASVGPKIVCRVHKMLSDMPAERQAEFLKTVDADALTIMIEFNDPAHEHIFPIESERADHVAILSGKGYPIPQKEAYAFFDKFGLERVACDIHTNMSDLGKVMDEIRLSKDTEGAVIYLERADDVPVGLIKVKSDHYVIARRTRETMRSCLVDAMAKGADSSDALTRTRERFRKGMKELSHVAGCRENHTKWSEFAIAFSESWAKAYNAGNATTKRALAEEYHSKYGSLYHRFFSTREVLPLSEFSTNLHSTNEGSAADRGGGKGKGRRKGGAQHVPGM